MRRTGTRGPSQPWATHLGKGRGVCANRARGECRASVATERGRAAQDRKGLPTPLCPLSGMPRAPALEAVTREGSLRCSTSPARNARPKANARETAEMLEGADTRTSRPDSAEHVGPPQHAGGQCPLRTLGLRPQGAENRDSLR